MDESQARVAIDLSGRPALLFEARFERPVVGEMATEMVKHFFASLSQSLGAAIQVSVSGDNTHHQIEACFKAVGRALEEFRRRVAIEELRAIAGKLDFEDRLEEQHEADLKRQRYLEELWSQGDNGNR